MISYTIVNCGSHNLENCHVFGFARMMCCDILLPHGILQNIVRGDRGWAHYDPNPKDAFGSDDRAAHHTCKSQNMVIFEIIIPAGDDSVRNHTQKYQSTTKHDVFMFTETIPTIECRQNLFFLLAWGTAEQQACNSQNMVTFEILIAVGDDSVRNHTQKYQSTTKHDVFMFTETLPTIECRQNLFPSLPRDIARPCACEFQNMIFFRITALPLPPSPLPSPLFSYIMMA